MNKVDEQYQELLEIARTNENIFGFWLDGSRGKGMVTEHSDYDCTMVVRDSVAEEYKHKYEVYGRPDIECGVMTLQEFSDYAAWGSAEAWDRYNFAHLKTLVDKTDGKILKMIDEKAIIPADKIRELVTDFLEYYLNRVYRSIKCFRDKKIIAAHLEAADSVPSIINAVFALHGRPAPYYKYLEWELKKWPLVKLSWTGDEFVQKLVTILSTADLSTQQGVLKVIETTFRAEGYGEVFDGWGEKLVWAQGYKLPS